LFDDLGTSAICPEMNPTGLDMADVGGYMPANAGFTGRVGA
jgi:hypothetical protein